MCVLVRLWLGRRQGFRCLACAVQLRCFLDVVVKMVVFDVEVLTPFGNNGVIGHVDGTIVLNIYRYLW